jgi:HTH-type transcriptional regulator/antitoxin HipB
MNQFPIRTPDQLPVLLQGFRKAAGLTQREVALRLGVTQQTYSALERNADSEPKAEAFQAAAPAPTGLPDW